MKSVINRVTHKDERNYNKKQIELHIMLEERKKKYKAIRLMYGIGCDKLTLVEAAKIMGCSKENVRLHRVNGFKKLQENKDLFKKLLN